MKLRDYLGIGLASMLGGMLGAGIVVAVLAPVCAEVALRGLLAIGLRG